MSLSRRRLLVLGSAIIASGALSVKSQAVKALPANDGTWSDNPLWPVLKETHLTTDSSGAIHAAFAPGVLGLADKPMTISGFILPIENTTSYRHFILSRYSPECPFCPAGGPNEVIEVFAKSSIAPTSAMVVMNGMFSVQGDMDKGMFYRLGNAQLA